MKIFNSVYLQMNAVFWIGWDSWSDKSLFVTLTFAKWLSSGCNNLWLTTSALFTSYWSIQMFCQHMQLKQLIMCFKSNINDVLQQCDITPSPILFYWMEATWGIPPLNHELYCNHLQLYARYIKRSHEHPYTFIIERQNAHSLCHFASCNGYFEPFLAWGHVA